ncbi:hypothetical protein B0T25DRAFT_573984 [Lasiosphaeria hispida]|uniref:GCN5-related N-acetyltransferase Rv2170-like domain-containing protein n=1 Tax=Lasiosphaeria hispida TaxID=260671 RepID=A0AAJ0H6Q3_9PEZI|nr:hypothetical protein B0T25DRAFT_573984 [Lasiosphaeria hispida]
MSPPNPITRTTTPTAPAALLAALTPHLPHSLPLLRRLQFAHNIPGGTTATTRVVWARYGDSVGELFAAAYVDLSRGPETECWLYSTMEDAVEGVGAEEVRLAEGEEGEEEEELVLEVLRGVRELEEGGEGARFFERGWFMVGSLHEVVRQRLIARGVGVAKTRNVAEELEWEFCGKWLFRVEALEERGLPQGMGWDVATRADVPVIQGLTSMPRKEATLLLIPSTVVRLDDGTPVAWAFLGYDGTLMTLHVEEKYRGRGLAKAVACRLMCKHLNVYGDDGWGAADVFDGNLTSQAVCKSIGGKLSWPLSWAMIDLFSIGDSV